MNDIAIGALLLALAIGWAAWVERRADNRRDAQLLAGFATGSGLTSLTLWLL